MKVLISAVALLGVLAVAACDNSSSNTTPTTPTPAPTPTPTPTPTGSTVSIVQGASLMTTTAFSPNPLSVSPGTTVTWVNNDTISHTSTSDNGIWNSGVIAPGSSFSTTLQNAGTFPYHCSIHPGMVATITVQ